MYSLDQQFKLMSRSTLTPQKANPKPTLPIKKHPHDDLSPFADQSFHPANTPRKFQLEYLQSPLSIKKDLFSQLLGTDSKITSPCQICIEDIPEEDSFNYYDEDLPNSSSCSSDSEDASENYEEDQNGVKKRKRKSTVQIRMLRQELDGEMNWTKDKICKMAEITGLSQSQVYKWCWDQKKKNQKYHRDSTKGFKRKMIRKEIMMRGRDQEEWKEYAQTKPKIKQGIEEHEDTDKKVNKRLIFN